MEVRVMGLSLLSPHSARLTQHDFPSAEANANPQDTAQLQTLSPSLWEKCIITNQGNCIIPLSSEHREAPDMD